MVRLVAAILQPVRFLFLARYFTRKLKQFKPVYSGQPLRRADRFFAISRGVKRACGPDLERARDVLGQ